VNIHKPFGGQISLTNFEHTTPYKKKNKIYDTKLQRYYRYNLFIFNFDFSLLMYYFPHTIVKV